MSTLTIRLPEDRHARLRNLAKSRGISLNRLMDELATAAVAQHDAELRFRVRATRGSKLEGLALLDNLDRAFERGR
jgi:predicted transcriptional regulator